MNTVLRITFLSIFCLHPIVFVHAQDLTSSHPKSILAAKGKKAIGYRDGQLIVTDILSNQEIGTIDLSSSEIPYFYTISDDGRWVLYSSKKEKTTYIYDIDNACQLKQILPFVIETVAFTKDGGTAYLIHSRSFWKAYLSTYDTQNWHLHNSRSISDYANSLAIDDDNSQLLAAGRSIVWDIDPKTLRKKKVNWEASRLKNLIFNPTMKHQYASVNHKNVIEVRDLQADRVIHSLRTEKGAITQLAYAPDGRHLMSLDDVGHLSIWDLQDSLKVDSMEGIEAAVGFEEGKLSVYKQHVWHLVDNSNWPKKNAQKHTSAQPDDAFLGGSTKKVNIVPLPIISYTPEASMILGMGMSFVFNDNEGSQQAQSHFFRPSSLTPMVSYGFNGQWQASIHADYFHRRGWRFFNQIGFLKNNRSFFFGIGHDADRGRNSVYHNHIFSWEGEVAKLIKDRFFAGIKYHVRNDSPLEYDTSSSWPVPDNEGGFLAGIGAVLRYDTRNDLLFPTKGRYIDLSFIRYDNRIGSDFEYNDLQLDYRSFYPLHILTDGTTIAFQAIYHNTYGGDIPFYQLPHLSADRILRGVWRNLYIDRQAIAVQGELRSNFSDIDPRYGYVLFAGAGDVAPSFFKNYTPRIVGVFGTGYRQQIIPKLKLQSRVDLSFTTRGDLGISGGIGLTF
ncbi:WD40 repeat domain-containing protein [Olivibacter sitiensis]|uniref:WD40 repeat domain-containing protein n=1 Tax=Olivibacter sitiensis TaxID=376470 RepID=UPI0004283041|nr:WD40 repeat domain-containing protein [Olivibacter sitiensis]